MTDAAVISVGCLQSPDAVKAGCVSVTSTRRTPNHQNVRGVKMADLNLARDGRDVTYGADCSIYRMISKSLRALQSIKSRMAARVIVRGPDECWGWVTKSKAQNWYGSIGYGRGVLFKASRVAWVLANGPIPLGMCVCHRCDNPPCTNPNHLFLGTKADNTKDMMDKGRMCAPPHSYGAAHHNAKFSLSSAIAIKGDRRPARIVAAEYGVSDKTIYRIRQGVSWTRELNGV